MFVLFPFLLTFVLFLLIEFIICKNEFGIINFQAILAFSCFIDKNSHGGLVKLLICHG